MLCDELAAGHAGRGSSLERSLYLTLGMFERYMTAARLSLLAELAPDLTRVSLFRFVPLPGTQVYASPETYGVTGTHLQPGWDGGWSAFHIHHNTRRWWGTDTQWAQVQSSYQRLHDFVEATWGPQG
jgi:hypothetical protein